LTFTSFTKILSSCYLTFHQNKLFNNFKNINENGAEKVNSGAELVGRFRTGPKWYGVERVGSEMTYIPKGKHSLVPQTT
jgi:hypothetical protein